jgi:hypothetical protein
MAFSWKIHSKRKKGTSLVRDASPAEHVTTIIALAFQGTAHGLGGEKSTIINLREAQLLIEQITIHLVAGWHTYVLVPLRLRIACTFCHGIGSFENATADDIDLFDVAILELFEVFEFHMYRLGTAGPRPPA